MKFTKLILPLLIILAGCNENPPQNNTVKNEPKLDLNTIATFPNGILTTQELEEHILDLPINERWFAEDPRSGYQNIINNLIIQKQLLSEAKNKKLDQSQKYKFMVRELNRNAYSNQYLATKNNGILIDESAVEDYYEKNIERFQLKEKRKVYHIFKSNEISEDAKDSIAKIRQRVINGESFKLLAQALSDSESRHKSGSLEVVEKGQYSEDFDDIVFSLEKNVPSEIVSTKFGYNIFFVTEILEAKTFSFNEVKNMLQKELLDERIEEFIRDTALELPKIEPTYIIDKNDLPNTVNVPNATIVKIGDFTLTSSQFYLKLEEIYTQSPNKKFKDLTYDYINDVAHREIIYQHMLSEGVPFMDQKSLDIEKSSLLLKEYSHIKTREYVNARLDLIKEYYEKNKIRYTENINVNLQILTIPLNENINLMPQLEMAIKDLDNGTLELSSLAEKFNGRLLNTGFKNSVQLTKFDPVLLKLAFKLEVKKHSAPYTTQTSYNIVKLLDKKEAGIPSFESIKNKVISDYIKENEAFLFNDIKKEIIQKVYIDESKLTSLINNSKI